MYSELAAVEVGSNLVGVGEVGLLQQKIFVFVLP